MALKDLLMSRKLVATTRGLAARVDGLLTALEDSVHPPASSEPTPAGGAAAAAASPSSPKAPALLSVAGLGVTTPSGEPLLTALDLSLFAGQRLLVRGGEPPPTRHPPPPPTLHLLRGVTPPHLHAHTHTPSLARRPQRRGQDLPRARALRRVAAGRRARLVGGRRFGEDRAAAAAVRAAGALGALDLLYPCLAGAPQPPS